MKTALICAALCGVAFLGMAYQTGLLAYGKHRVGVQPIAETPVVKGPQFPADLAPAARAQAVPQAAPFKPEDKIYPLVYLTTSGTLHDWQDDLDPDWASGSVERTQLAVIVGAMKHSTISIQTYPNGAPPVRRVQFEVEASIVEAKTGKVLANRTFVNVPRSISPLEAWALTAIGKPVSQRTVFRWVASQALAGFPQDGVQTPLTNVVE